MVLKALEMQGFKSFPDKTVLEFDQGMTAVIGPNGSGKSNISDAVRWVLGEQSTKSLRGSKMEDVIFSGTGVRKAQGFAEVTLHLDNTDRTLQTDRDDVRVTRKYYRSGESEYQLNGETVRLRDVHELFMDTGLGRDGYSLVSQGRVADLVASRSSQRREMLEEAAGISHFRYRRTDANRRLDQAEENLVRLRDILAELEARVGPLKIQSEKAQKYLALATQKREVEIGLWLHTIDKSKKGLQEQDHKLSLAQLQYTTLEQELAALAQQMEDSITAAQQITLQIEQVRQGAAEHEEKATALEGQISVEENTIAHNQASIERITRDMQAAADTQQHIDDQIQTAQAEIDTLAQHISEQQQQLAALSQDTSGIQDQSRAFTQRVGELTKKRVEAVAQLSDRRVEQSTDVSSAQEIRNRLESITELLASKSGVLEELRAAAETAQAQHAQAEEELAAVANSIAGYQMLAQSRGEKAGKQKQEVESAQYALQQKRDRVKMLEDLEKNMEGYAGSVKAVMRESARGTISGIHGPLSQLITVEKEYTTAIETALGAAVQYIVTQTEQDAKRGIAFLKENRAGRATFLPISAIRARSFTEKNVERCAGFIGMADTLVQVDKQYREIISAQLARTVVVETIDHAIAVAKQYAYRFRIVTLDGQVLNAGGSMTGGSRSQSAGFLSRGNEIEALHNQIAQQTTALETLRQSYQETQTQAQHAQAQLDAVQADLTTAQEECIRKESALQIAREKYQSAEGSLADLTTEQQSASQRLAQLEESCNAYEAAIAQHTEAIEQLDAEMRSVEQEREALQVQLSETAQKEADANMQILAMNKDMQAKYEVIDALQRRKSSHTGRIGDLNEEIGAIAQHSLDIKQTIATLRAQVAALREKSGDSRQQVEALVAKRNEAEKHSGELRAAEREKNGVREGLGAELARLEERRDVLQRAMEDAQNKLYDEYQLTLREAQALEIQLEEPAKAQKQLNEIKGKIRALGTVNVAAVEEYKEVSERYEFLKTQIEDVERSREELGKLIAELTDKMALRFREMFTKINTCFASTFQELFNGGAAELALENPLDILESAIEIRVQPPGKNVQNIDLLSGGEKGLSAIALLFAILKITPAPFCIFDEVEAALDDVNVSRYAQYVRRMTKNTQFILITHRRGTMEEADVLYGVTMQEEGVSKLLRLKTAEMAKQLGIA